MKKGIFLILASVLIFSYTDTYAQEATSTPSVYKVTINRFRISSDGGTTWIILSDTPTEFDIASVNAGAAVGNFFGGSIAPGTYNMIERTISATFKMQGYMLNAVGATDYYTSTTAANGTNSTANFDPDNPPADYGEATITIFGYNQGDALPVEQESVNIAVQFGATKKVNIDFNVSNTLALYNMGGGTYRLMPAPPTVTATIE